MNQTKKEEKYRDNKAKVFNVIIGQCEKPMKDKLESTNGFEGVESRNDVIGLLTMIKDIAFDVNDRKYVPLQAFHAWKQISNLWQKDDEAVLDYYKRFTSAKELVERTYGKIAPDGIAQREGKEFLEDPVATMSIARSRMLAVMFMDGANKKLFGSLMRSLESDFVLGAGMYPETVEDALQVLTLHGEHGLQKGGKK